MREGADLKYALIVLLLAAPAAAGEPFRVVGYLPDYRAANYDLSPAKQLTDLIVFSAQPTADGGLDLSRLKNVPWAKLRAFKTQNRVRLILCVGGWERSKHFAAVATSAEKRTAFATAAVQTCLAERLDGLDLDWEHPKDAAEQDGYGKLLADLRESFAPHGLTLSVTIAAWQKLPKEAFAAVDSVNVMAYDHRGKHSTFEGATDDVKKVLALGAPAEKIVLGLPFYGRDVARPSETRTYREIAAKFKLPADADEVDGISFNGPATIRRKVEFARGSNLGGVMVWELGQDAAGGQSLLTAIRTAADA
jgi:chitinase